MQGVHDKSVTWGVQPGLPVYLLNGVCAFEVITEELLEVCSGECAELEVLQVGFQECFKGLGPPHKPLHTQVGVSHYL